MDILTGLVDVIIGFLEAILNIIKALFEAIINFLEGILSLFSLLS